MISAACWEVAENSKYACRATGWLFASAFVAPAGFGGSDSAWVSTATERLLVSSFVIRADGDIGLDSAKVRRTAALPGNPARSRSVRS